MACGTFKNGVFTSNKGVKKLQNSNFLNTIECKELREMYLQDIEEIDKELYKDLLNVKIFDAPKLKKIGDKMFCDSTTLEQVYIPEATSIGERAFEGCKSLKEVNCPEATSIGERAFEACKSLKEINCPEATSIGERAFEWCKSLKEINCPKVTTVGDSAFSFCRSLRKFNCPEATSIGTRAFGRCIFLEEINCPKVTTVGDSTFSSCISLKNFNCPEAISIGECAFEECKALEEINLSKVTSVGQEGFSYCTNLKKVVIGEIKAIPEEITLYDIAVEQGAGGRKLEIGKNIFKGCFDLPLRSIAFWPFGKFNKGTGEFKFNDDIKEFDSYIFRRNKDVKILNLNNIESIEPYSFANCEKLEKVVAPKLRISPEGSFKDCKSLKVMEGDSIEIIKEYAFKNCVSLDTVNLKNVDQFHECAFENCPKLIQKIKSSKSLDDFSPVILEKYFSPKDMIGFYGTLENGKFTVKKGIKKFETPVLGKYGYYQKDEKITKVDLQDVEKIGIDCFNCCKSLKEIEGNKVKEIGMGAFSQCEDLENVIFKNVDVIGWGSFLNCKKLNKVVFENLTTIGERAFYKCENLREAYFKNLTTIYEAAFSGCKSLERVKLTSLKPDSEIGENIFKGCTKLREIELSKAVESELMVKLFFPGVPFFKNYFQEKKVEDAQFDTENDKKKSYDQKYKFSRVTNDPIFPYGSPKVQDIAQGAVGDCWLLAALASLVKSNPRSIVDCFSFDENKPDKVFIRLYKVSLENYKKEDRYIPSSVVKIEMDKSIPVSDSWLSWLKGVFGFRESAFGDRHALWVRLLEKAFAIYLKDLNGLSALKLRENLDGGYPAFAISAITGKTTKLKKIRDKENYDKIFASLLRKVKERRAVTTSLGAGKRIEGLPNTHAYSVVQLIKNGELIEQIDSDYDEEILKFMKNINCKKENKYVALRNPHAGVGVFFEKGQTRPRVIRDADGICILEISIFSELFELVDSIKKNQFPDD